jgi:hypothetical protein
MHLAIFYTLTIVIRVTLAAIFQSGLVFYGLYVGVVFTIFLSHIKHLSVPGSLAIIQLYA